MIQRAQADGGFESHEIASFLKLILDELEITKSKKIFKFLVKCKVENPMILADLADKDIVLDLQQIMHILFSECPDAQSQLGRLEDALEQGVVGICDVAEKVHESL